MLVFIIKSFSEETFLEAIFWPKALYNSNLPFISKPWGTEIVTLSLAGLGYKTTESNNSKDSEDKAVFLKELELLKPLVKVVLLNTVIAPPLVFTLKLPAP